MHKKPGRHLRTTTIGGVKAAGLGLTALCHNARCKHKAELNLDQMIEQFGADRKFRAMSPRCSECGQTDAGIVINWENYGPTQTTR